MHVAHTAPSSKGIGELDIPEPVFPLPPTPSLQHSQLLTSHTRLCICHHHHHHHHRNAFSHLLPTLTQVSISHIHTSAPVLIPIQSPPYLKAMGEKNTSGTAANAGMVVIAAYSIPVAACVIIIRCVRDV
ncbi:hypothetical protein GQ43DRAFT_439222, partial [Delitschia confertaspora ATCC 74209]